MEPYIPRKTSYNFTEAEKARSFVKTLQEEFSLAADAIRVYSEKTVSLEVPPGQEKAITEAANKLGGYVSIKPDYHL